MMKRKLLSLLLAFVLICSFAPAAMADPPEPEKIPEKQKIIEKLNRQSDGELVFCDRDGSIFLSGRLTGGEKAGEASALRFLDENKALFGIGDVNAEWKKTDERKDDIGDTFVEFAQEIDGLPVEGCMLSVHFDKQGAVASVSGHVLEDKTLASAGGAEIPESEAVETAKRQFTYESLKDEPKAEKLIAGIGDKNHTVFKVSIHYLKPNVGSYFVYVDAHTGEVLKTENRIRNDGPATGSGVDVQGKTRNLNLYYSKGNYYMYNAVNPAATGIYTLSLSNGTDVYDDVYNSKNTFDTDYFKAPVSAHYFAGRVLDFYRKLFGRNSLDGNGMRIDSYTHYGVDYSNAFWDGAEIVYGDGDGVSDTSYCADLDVVGHEMTHGVTEYAADLEYHNQSGALDESFADVFGVLIETYDKYGVDSGGFWKFDPADWVVGDEVCLPGSPCGAAFRSLADPGLYDQPDNMKEYRSLPDTEEGDYGGVHANSGIPNKAAYLIAGEIGMEATARIYYRALENYLYYYNGFEIAMNDLIQSAKDLYGSGSPAVGAIRNAFVEVGVIIDDPYEPNNTKQTAYPITAGMTYESYISPGYDEDYYVMPLEAGFSVHAELNNLPGTYGLKIIGPDGSSLAYDTSYNKTKIALNCDTSSKGNYYFYVFSGSAYSTTQKYALTVTVSSLGFDTYEPNNDFASAYAISEGIEYQAYLPDSSDEDYFKFDINTKSDVWIKLDTPSFLMTLYNNNKTYISSIYSTDDTKYLYRTLSAGTYYVQFTLYFSTTASQYSFHMIKNFICESGISIDRKSVTLAPGGNLKLTATISPANATNQTVIWESSNSHIATVDQQGNVKALKPGSATITARTAESELQAGCAVTVGKAVTAVSLPDTLGLYKGQTYTLAARITPSDATDKSVTWSSSNPSVATVDNTGKITAVELGSATVTATAANGGPSDACAVTVSRPANGLTLDRNSASLSVGQSITLIPTLYPSDAPNPKVYWSTTNAYVASVDRNGTVTAKGFGVTTITAVSANGGHKATCAVTVNSLGAPAAGASSASYNSVRVSWAASGGASGYEIYRAASVGGKYSRIASTTSLSYTDKGLAAKTYYYKVRAYRNGSPKLYSGFSSVRHAKPVPGRPSSAAAKAASCNSITISWNAVAGATKYELYRSTSSTGGFKLLTATASRRYTNRSVNTGTTYYYKVRAYRASGGSKAYGGYSAVTSAKATLGKPASIKAAKSSGNAVRLSWGAVSGRTKYEVWRSTQADGKYARVATVPGTAYTDKNLKKGTSYYYKVRAYRLVSGKKIYGGYTRAASAKP